MEMKIGILTFHRAHNYGAVLQCYALQEYLKQQGHNVEVIDYRQKFIEKVYSPFNLQMFIQDFFRLRKRTFKHILLIIKKIRCKRLYEQFIEKHIYSSTPCNKNNIPSKYDAIIIGSDQMWNTKLTGGYDSIYWGEMPKEFHGRLIGYAISTNIRNLSLVSSDIILKALSHFSAFSFREANLTSYINETLHSKFKVKTTLDPTLLVNREVWDSLIINSFQSRRYVVIYQARGYAKEPDLLIKKAAVLAEKMNCEVINLIHGEYSPCDFVSIFRYALCVITTSFHAVAFSLIFNRPLYAIRLNDGNDRRYADLLEYLGAGNMLVDTGFIPEIIDVNYEEINCNLEKMRTESIDFLNTILK